MFHALTEAEGENDTDYDDEYDEDRHMNVDIDMADEGDEETSFPPPREFRAPGVVAPRPHRLRNDSPGRNYTGPEDIVMEVDPSSVPPRPPSSTGAQISFHRGGGVYLAQAVASAQFQSGLRDGTGRRPRGFGQQPLIEPATSPAPSETMSSRSTGTAQSNGAGFFRSYREAAAVAGSSRYNVLTPDLDYAEIGHGRGTRGTSDNGSNAAGATSNTSTSTLRGYDMQYDARTASPMTFPIPRRGYTVDNQMQGQQQHVVLNASNPYQQHHPMEREVPAARTSRRSHRQRTWEEGGDTDRSPSRSPTTRELQESVQNALGGGAGVGGQSGSHHMNNDARGRAAGRRGWRNTLTAAEQYASSFLFGGRGGGPNQDG